MSTAMTPWGPLDAADGAAPGRRAEILDAAAALFLRRGVAATTMTQIAAATGISRVWLYRHFDSRDALMRALVRREVSRFLDGLAATPVPDDAVGACVAATVYAIGFLRGHELLQRLMVTEAAVVLPFLTTEAGGLYRRAVQIGAAALIARTGCPPDGAERTAEVLVRFVAAVALLPPAVVDFDDPDQARAVVAPLVTGLLTA